LPPEIAGHAKAGHLVSKHSPTQEVNNFVAVQPSRTAGNWGPRQDRGHDLTLPRHVVPEFCLHLIPLKAEGAGKAGCQVHPQPRMQRKQRKKHTRIHYRYAETIRPSLRDGLAAYTCSPRCTGFLATVARRPSPANLIPASGDQDHTTSPSASRITRQLMPTRPPHPAPDTRDDREAPLLWARDAQTEPYISEKRKCNIFAPGP
jgi:hypothetical protein